ncbi:MAG: hypothetical protein HYT93_04625 [Parcubacteria group bacterium]|nr:hypothetical protein [Parcubacteria group bacterium]
MDNKILIWVVVAVVVIAGGWYFLKGNGTADVVPADATVEQGAAVAGDAGMAADDGAMDNGAADEAVAE